MIRLVALRVYVAGCGRCELRLPIRAVLPLEVIKLDLACFIYSLQAVPHRNIIILTFCRCWLSVYIRLFPIVFVTHLLVLLFEEFIHLLLWLSLWLWWWLLPLNEASQDLNEYRLSLSRVHKYLLVQWFVYLTILSLRVLVLSLLNEKRILRQNNLFVNYLDLVEVNIKHTC